MEVIIILTTYISGITHIVKGEYSNIKDFPHMVFLTGDCNEHIKNNFFTCGASILNQAILLSAAHCLDGCLASSEIMAYTGHERKYEGFKTQVTDFKTHENFDSYELDNDIALLRLQKSLHFGVKVKRVAVMRKPPYGAIAVVAGWSRIDENDNASDWLMHMTQKIIPHQACAQVLGEFKIPAGAFCAKEGYGTSNLGKGGSGSALIVRKFIQIGLLSFHMPKRSKTIVVYTDVGYFYDWISRISKKLYCNEKKRKR